MSSNSSNDLSAVARYNKNRARRAVRALPVGFAFRVSCRVPCHPRDSRRNSKRGPVAYRAIGARKRNTPVGNFKKFRSLWLRDAITFGAHSGILSGSHSGR